ncbi:hypothetical protein FXO37_26858 [Capsicum annuum]|nr:hypothetical protein FXO37_26858 [Capsicum annuum]
MRQKARATWIECGDSNTKYFHAQWKLRVTHNAIVSIYTESGEKLTNPKMVEEEFIVVFASLMGDKISMASSPEKNHVPLLQFLLKDPQMFNRILFMTGIMRSGWHVLRQGRRLISTAAFLQTTLDFQQTRYASAKVLKKEIALHVHFRGKERLKWMEMYVSLGDNRTSWASKKQRTVARSSTESEYTALAAELTWTQSLLF